VSFPISCAPAVQEQFDRGVALLHSFAYTAAENAFQGANRLSLIGFPQSTRQRDEVVRKDPALLELNVQLAESNLLSGSPSV
jgi:hypothetical protein